MQMLKIIYDAEVVSEEAIIAWADEKQLAEEEEKKLLRKVGLPGSLRWCLLSVGVPFFACACSLRVCLFSHVPAVCACAFFFMCMQDGVTSGSEFGP